MTKNPIELHLHRGDCIEVMAGLPEKSIDCVITDPPYCSGGNSIRSKQVKPTQKYLGRGSKYPEFEGDSLDQRTFMLFTRTWLRECKRVMKDGALFVIFSDWRNLCAATDAVQLSGLRWRGVGVWDKGLRARPNYGLRHQCEFLIWGSNGDIIDKEPNVHPGCFRHGVIFSDKHHATGKPTALMRELVKIARPNAMILDPFCGSGSTGVACMIEGRSFIGIEREAAYLDITQKRLDELAKDMGLNKTEAV